MSYTNQTQHYGLPQYVGTDVPAWLTDINGAFAAIDTGMNAAKTQADGAATAAGQAANDIAALTTTVNAQAAQISAAAQAASAAQTTANTADGKADALDTRVTALEESGAIQTKDVPFSQAMGQWIAPLSVGPNPISILNELPTGKTMDDVIGLEIIQPDNACWYVINGTTLSIVSILTGVTISGKLRITYK